MAEPSSEKVLPNVPGDTLGAITVQFLFLQCPHVNLDSHHGKMMHQDCLVLFHNTKPGSCLWRTIVGSLFRWGLHHQGLVQTLFGYHLLSLHGGHQCHDISTNLFHGHIKDTELQMTFHFPTSDT